MDGMLLAARAMQAQQAALNVTGENLSNVNTPGYSRQRIDPLVEPVVSDGTGPPGFPATSSVGDSFLTTDSVQRFTNDLVTQALRSETSDYQAASTSQAVLQQASTILSELGGTGIGHDASAFFDSVQQAASTPNDLALRQTILENAASVATSFNARAAQLQQLRTDTGNQVQDAVAQVNSILTELAQINQGSQQPATVQSNALLDRRDVLLNKLSEYVSVQAVQQPNGDMVVYQGGTPLVFGRTARQLSVSIDGTGQANLVTDAGRTLAAPGGKLGSLLDAENNALPSLSTQLDQAASAFMANVNGILANGSDLNGQPGAPLFAGSGAADMKVSMTDPSALGFAATSLSSTTSIAAAGTSVQEDQTLSSQAASFALPPVASGVVAVNGVNIAWNSSQSLSSILASFKAAGVNATFDAARQQVVLTRDPSTTGGAPGPGVTVSDVTGNFTAFANLAGAAPNNGVPGEGTAASALANLSTAAVFGGQTLLAGIHQIGTNVASSAAQLQEEASTSQGLQSTLQAQRDSVVGVNSDEEAVHLLQYQRAYEAALRLANAQDEMLNTLINHTGGTAG